MGDVAKALPIVGPLINANADKHAGDQANQVSQQNQQAQNTELQQQDEALKNAMALANQLSSENYTQAISDAGKGAINSFENDAGGVPNIGALVKSLFGDNIANAMSAAARQRSGNLSSAMSGIEGISRERLGAGAQYGGNARYAGEQASNAYNAENAAYGQAGSQAVSAFTGMSSFGGGNTKTATGLGSSGFDPYAINGSGTSSGGNGNVPDFKPPSYYGD